MKGRLNKLLLVVFIFIFLWIGIFVYFIETAYKCPAWYTDDTFFWYTTYIEKCNDCELTKRQYELWEKPIYNDECKIIEKMCYVCVEKLDPFCDCIPQDLLLKID